ncbi:MAG: HNH endonuclease [Firmicutes bacterium]|nr:HNH endonuclease [Bacillota bacterium]
MPRKPLKPCRHPGCPELTEDKYCNNHKNLYINKRETASKRGYDSRWRKARSKYLKGNPLCIHCKEKGKLTRATVVDHIEPHRGDRTLFWDESNWQPLCKKCHDKKTMTEDRYKEYRY